MGFDPYNRSLKVWESIGTLTPKVGAHLGVWGFIPWHFFTLPGTWDVTLELPSWPAPLQTLALVASPRLGLRHICYVLWCSLSPLIVLCWCSLTHFFFILLMFVNALLMCFIGVCLHLFVVFCWYLSTPLYCALLVFINAPLLCSDIGGCWCLLVNIGVQVLI